MDRHYSKVHQLWKSIHRATASKIAGEKIRLHELVYMMFDDATGVTQDDAEVWIAEGIAVLYAKQTDLRYVSEINYPKLVELIGFDNFVDEGGFDYAGIYVWYFVKKYGFAKFLEVYREECEWQGMIYDGFEKEAIQNYLRYVPYLIPPQS